MLNVSKNFKNDIISTNQPLKPVLVIADADNNPLFTLTQDKEELFDVDGNSIRSINVISKVSNIKISTDYDSKTLKINRLRCTLYNYYDVNTKLSEYINTNITNKNLYLFYKSPSTDRIHITPTDEDRECSLIYNGEISRIKYNDKTIDLSVEDKTQIKIADKQVPYIGVDRLPFNISEHLTEEYKGSDLVVPMTFGQVDKAPVLTYEDWNNDRMLNVLFDVQPTTANHKTAKIPRMLNSSPAGDYCLYVKKDEDYLIWNHFQNSFFSHHSIYSKIKVLNRAGTGGQFLMPELQEESDSQEPAYGHWDDNGFYQRMVDTVYATEGIIYQMSDVEIDNMDNEFENIESINDNGGNPKKWFRPNETTTLTSNFDTGIKLWQRESVGSIILDDSSYTYGLGRWIILKIDSSVDNSLINIQDATGYIGNTFMLADWELRQSDDGTTPNDDSIATDTVTRTGFFVSPLSTKIFKEVLTQIDLPAFWMSDNHQRALNVLNCLLLETDEEISSFLSSIHNNHAQATDPYLNCPMYLLRDEDKRGSDNYWGSVGVANGISGTEPIKKIGGLYYGATGSDEHILTANEANSHNLIAIFEFYTHPLGMQFDEGGYEQGLKMNNIGFLQSVKIEAINTKEIFASITGRKNNFYTEELEYTEESTVIPNIPNMLNGVDGVLPSDEELLNGWWALQSEVYNAVLDEHGTQYFEALASTSCTGIQYQNLALAGNGYYDISLGDTFDTAFTNRASIDDSAMWNVNYLWKRCLWRVGYCYLTIFDLGNVAANLLYAGAENFQSVLESESLNKSIGKYIFEYLFQKDIDYEPSFTFDFYSVAYYQNGAFVPQPIDITDAVESRMNGYRWNDFTVTNYTEYWENFYAYLDNLVYAVNYSYGEALEPYDLTNGLNNFPDKFVWWAENRYGVIDTISELQNTDLFIEQIMADINNYVAGLDPQTYTTDGIIQKPSDIVMNILTTEMEYGKLLEEQSAGQDIVAPDYSAYNMDSIIESRNEHSGWKMGFSINKKRDGKKLIEDVLSESKSYPRFSSDGKFGLITIKSSYAYNDIDKVINLNDILSYNFKQTKPEDLIVSCKMFYRYDYGHKKYTMDIEKKIENYLPSWSVTGFDNYNIEEIDGHKDIELKYHSDFGTVDSFMKYKLLNNCNVHNLVELKLPLNYIDLEVGDKIHIPLINNEKIFNIDYSKVGYLNSQPIYPLWLVMETNIGTDGIKIKAYQLHYLGSDGNHGFDMPEQEYQVIGNMNEYNTTYPDILNWNYNPNANVHNDYEIPYGDVNADGDINILDITAVINHIVGTEELTSAQIERINGLQQNNDGVVNILDIIELVNIIIA